MPPLRLFAPLQCTQAYPPHRAEYAEVHNEARRGMMGSLPASTLVGGMGQGGDLLEVALPVHPWGYFLGPRQVAMAV